MFDDCNTFFKGKPDGRVAASTAVAAAARMRVVERPAAGPGRSLPSNIYTREGPPSRLVFKTAGNGAKVRAPARLEGINRGDRCLVRRPAASDRSVLERT